MKKIYLILEFFLPLLCYNQAYSQAPVINYPASAAFTVNQPIQALHGTNTGGAVPNQIYSKTVTIAGSGYYGYKDTVASFARFENPINSATDKNGNIYIVDANLNSIRKITPDGIVSTFAGSVNGEAGGINGNDTAARFNYPTGIAVDTAGNVFVADFGNSLIRKITPGGVVSTYAGNQNSGLQNGAGTGAKFNLPYALTFDHEGNLLVADTYNNSIRKITPLGPIGVVTTIYTAGSLNVPKGIAADQSGNIYVTEEQGNDIKKIDTLHNTVTVFATGALDNTASPPAKSSPIGIAVDKSNNVYVSSENTYAIQKYNPDGSTSGNYPSFSGGSLKGAVNGVDTLTKYRGNMGLFYDGQDNMIVTDPGSDLIKKVAVYGYTIFPRLPDGITLDSTGTITGTPTTFTPSAKYTITAYNSNGSSSADISLSVGQASQNITFNPISPVTYGTANFSPGAISTGTAIPVKYSSSDTTVATIVQDSIHVIRAGTTNITATQAGNISYLAAMPVTQTLIINKADLTVKADDKIKTAGKDNPALSISITGFVNKDSLKILTTQPTAQTTATAASPSGNYPITVSGADADNYTFNYVTGNLTVFPIPVITAMGPTYLAKGDSVLLSASPATGYTYQWAFNGTNIQGATGQTCYAGKTGAYTVSITAISYTTTSLYIPIIVQLQLPPDNFNIQLNSVTCKGSNNGSIIIAAVQKLPYAALVIGNNLNVSDNFTDTLKVENLSPGNYSVCISVDGETFNQCYQLNITEPKDLSVYSTINNEQGILNLHLDGGNTFNINLNNVNYTTTQNDINLPLTTGINKLTVTTDRLCQGVIEKTIDMTGIIAPYPNPFHNVLNINIGNAVISNMKISIISLLNGKNVYNSEGSNQSGVVKLDLSGLADGIYYLDMNLDNKSSGYKIIKK